MKKIKFRKFELESGNKILLGKNEKSNDELMKKFKGKENTIMHTSSPGSPFGVIEELNPSKNMIALSGAAVASYSQDWRDNKKDVMVNVFNGKNISKRWWMKLGTWKIKKSGKIKVKKQDIINFEKNANNRK
tara:strand:+ start:533 stop:928 length:396 start_codon:yes stop_codon:yes gene_type:complete